LGLTYHCPPPWSYHPRQDPLASHPSEGPLAPPPDRDSAIGNAPALVPGPVLRLDCGTHSCSLSYPPPPRFESEDFMRAAVHRYRMFLALCVVFGWRAARAQNV
jgi:hypothetical protein